MKKHRLPPQQVNWVHPQWRYAASGIRCRADWKGAHVYDTEVGWIIAYNQRHADETARAVLEDEALEHAIIDEREDLFG